MNSDEKLQQFQNQVGSILQRLFKMDLNPLAVDTVVKALATEGVACTPAAALFAAEAKGYQVIDSLGSKYIRFPKVVKTHYRVYVLVDAYHSIDDPYPDQVLGTLTVPYVDSEVLTVFDDYPTEQAAREAILKNSGLGADNTEYVIVPVTTVQTDYLAIKNEEQKA